MTGISKKFHPGLRPSVRRGSLALAFGVPVVLFAMIVVLLRCGSYIHSTGPPVASTHLHRRQPTGTVRHPHYGRLGAEGAKEKIWRSSPDDATGPAGLARAAMRGFLGSAPWLGFRKSASDVRPLRRPSIQKTHPQ